MDALLSCRFCLLRSPDKDLKTPYIYLDKPVIYTDMIKECFEIHLSVMNDECGICYVCVGRLQDAHDFKLQVLRVQEQLRLIDKSQHVADTTLAPKSEPSDDGSGNDCSPYEEPEIKYVMDSVGKSEDCLLNEEFPAKSDILDYAMPDASFTTREGLACDGSEQVSPADNLPAHRPAHSSASLSRDVRGKFKRTRSLIDQNRVHTGEIPFRCEQCNTHYTSQASLKRHKRTHIDKPHHCDACNRRFQYRYLLIVHQYYIHKRKPEECPLNSENAENPNSVKCNESIKTDAPYACDVCGKTYARIGGLRQHNYWKHPENRFSCRQCGERCINKFDLKKHRRIHMNQEYSCDTCSRSFKYKGDLRRHIRTHGDVFLYRCELCDRGFHRKQFLKLHIVSHTGEKPFICDHCDGRFSQKRNLIRHMSLHTGETPRWMCDVCGNNYTRKISLQVHMRIHTGEKPYSCDICNKKFSIKKTLSQHVQYIHTLEKPFSCEVCNKQFKLAQHALLHKRLHTGEGVFVCETCGKPFLRKSHLLNHQQAHESVRRHSCGICGKSYKHKVNLNSHLKQHHTGKESYYCDVCNKKQSSKSNLIRHKALHTGEKKFVCSICERRFRAKTTLAIHMNSHTGERPFSCETCSRKFSDKSALRRHKMTHTGDTDSTRRKRSRTATDSKKSTKDGRMSQ